MYYSPKITDVEFEENSICQRIGNYTFEYCGYLASISIPYSVISIGCYAFYDCNSLTNIGFENTLGWYISQDVVATNGIDIDVANQIENVINFKLKYPSYYWKRNA